MPAPNDMYVCMNSLTPTASRDCSESFPDCVPSISPRSSVLSRGNESASMNDLHQVGAKEGPHRTASVVDLTYARKLQELTMFNTAKDTSTIFAMDLIVVMACATLTNRASVASPYLWESSSPGDVVPRADRTVNRLQRHRRTTVLARDPGRIDVLDLLKEEHYLQARARNLPCAGPHRQCTGLTGSLILSWAGANWFAFRQPSLHARDVIIRNSWHRIRIHDFQCENQMRPGGRQ